MGAGWLLCAVFAWGSIAQAAPGEEPPLLPLDAAQADQMDVVSALAWFGAQPPGGIAAASGGRLRFEPLIPDQPTPFAPGKSLWLKLRLQAATGSTETWQLEVPLPVIDRVTLYQQDASGHWIARTAGDTVPMREWPQAGRYPSFPLQLRPGVPADVYLEVRHAMDLLLPVRLVTTAVHQQRTQMEYMALGIVMGALALMVLAALLRAARLRDSAYTWTAAYALVAMLALAAFTGAAAHLLWGNAGAWVDAAPGCLTLLGGSVAVLLVARLSGLRARVQWLARSLRLLGWLGLALAALYPLLDRGTGLVLLGLHLVGVAALSLYASLLTWRRGDLVGLWLLLGSVPLAVSVLVAMARVTGWVQPTWLTEYALVLALTIDLPMLFAALNSRSEERRTVELRRLASANQDPLTGLMNRDPFTARLRQAIARYQRRGEDAAVAVIEVANYEWIQKTRGAEAAEEALLRAVIKLRRLVRDVDTTGRLGEQRFGLILEGVSMRRPMNSVASRLIAAGLMEEPGRPRDAVLHFHIGAVVLNEHSATADEMLQALDTVLDGMSPRTQRPFRFLDAQQGLPQSVAGAVDAVDSGMAPA